jgi:dGTPase
MNWNNIISGRRTGESNTNKEIRTDYQRDFDRIIFSSAFRRLQNKTQIFPLPGSTFVHNRLTHSLEVASVGRTLGKLVGHKLIEKNQIENKQYEFYKYELQNVVASACLAHDIGNPSFGHSGEEAISNYFNENKKFLIDGNQLSDFFSEEEWIDLINFEGNANSFRILTNQFNGKSVGGYRLTYATLAALLKYPCESNAIDKTNISTKKFSFFQSEKIIGNEILEELNVEKINTNSGVYKRHPFVYLTEAADDICYRIVDFEDAQRLHIIPHSEVLELFIELLTTFNKDDITKVKKTLKTISDKNEQISYLRAKCINRLTLESTELFINNSDRIIKGEYDTGLVDEITEQNPFLKTIQKISIDEIYNHDSVLQLEIAGYEIMSGLLKLFVPAVLRHKPNLKDSKVLGLLPKQFEPNNTSAYNKVMAVLDYLSGMTDEYAFELYRKLFGIEIPKHK